jgi:hypothetical protein
MEGEPDYAMVLLALRLILTEQRQQQMILLVNHPCGIYIVVVLVWGEGEIGRWSSKLCLGRFFVGNLLNSCVDPSIKLCMYVDNAKFKLNP